MRMLTGLPAKQRKTVTQREGKNAGVRTQSWQEQKDLVHDLGQEYGQFSLGQSAGSG